MAEYIDRDAALKELCENCAWTEKCNRYKNELPRCLQFTALSDSPAADVAEVRHGKWVWNGETCCNECSVCGVGAMWFRILMEYYYCPNCGAKMDMSEEDDI